MSHPYYTRFQARQARHAQVQQAKRHAEARHAEVQHAEARHAEACCDPLKTHSVNIPTQGIYRYTDADLIRAAKEVAAILSKMEAARYSTPSIIALFEYLIQFPFILIARPATGDAIRKKINEFKPIAAEHERRLTTFPVAHETMVKSLAAHNSQVQKAGMYLLRDYEASQRETAQWMRLKDAMEKLETLF